MEYAQQSERPGAVSQVANWSAESARAVAAICDERKAFATLRAQLAMAGHVVHELGHGGFLVCKFGLSKHCPDVKSLGAFATLVGARPNSEADAMRAAAGQGATP